MCVHESPVVISFHCHAAALGVHRKHQQTTIIVSPPPRPPVPLLRAPPPKTRAALKYSFMLLPRPRARCCITLQLCAVATPLLRPQKPPCCRPAAAHTTAHSCSCAPPSGIASRAARMPSLLNSDAPQAAGQVGSGPRETGKGCCCHRGRRGPSLFQPPPPHRQRMGPEQTAVRALAGWSACSLLWRTAVAECFRA